jgi:hypothetical protein
VVLGNYRHAGHPQRRRRAGCAASRPSAPPPSAAATYTGQLLAFSRASTSPVTLDVNALIRELRPLMRQAVGEAVTIELELFESR